MVLMFKTKVLQLLIADENTRLLTILIIVFQVYRFVNCIKKGPKKTKLGCDLLILKCSHMLYEIDEQDKMRLYDEESIKIIDFSFPIVVFAFEFY